MQQKCSAIYLILFLSIGSWQSGRIYANAQAANTSGSSPAPANGVERSIVGSPTPAGIPPATTSSPEPGSGTIPNTSSGTSGAVPATPGTVGTGSASSPAPGNTGIPTSPGPGMAAAYVIPVPDETAVVVKSRDECHLALSLFQVLGSENATACKNQTLSEYKGSADRSSSSNREGVVTTSVGAQFCVSVDGAEAVAAEANRLSFSSTDSRARELPDIYDPACDDPDADLRQGCSGLLPSASSFMDVTSNTDSSNSSTDSNAQGTSAADTASSPDTSTQLADCARKFLRVGRVPRSAAIILLKWDRKYYKSKEDCCTEQGNPPNCDCNWSGYTYDNLPPPKAYSKYFTDECDLGPSINRAYYDLSGGKVTFHSKLRVPTPRGVLPNPTPDSSSSNSSSSGGVSTNSDSSTPPPPAGLDLSTSPSQPIETATSYLDPDGVDVYGWATLTDMRTDSGLCRDWCGDAMQQLNVNSNDYNHIICLQLLASKSLCDVCNGGDCVGTCPASTGITTGCGCATCYYAWGGQASCHRPGDPGTRVGMGANTRTYDGEMAANAGGPLIVAGEQLKRFITHEIGHNMGLTHTGSVNCKVDGDSSVSRDPQQCKPDWYGDTTSFMGSGGTLVVPNAIRYKVRWLPRFTLRTHPQGAEQTYTLRAASTRRPSWQSKNPPGWFSRNDALTVRVQLRNPPGSKQDVGGYSCPCTAAGKCPTCTSSNPGACDNGPCCLDAACADDGLNTLYIELHQPYRNDYEATNSGVAIRMMGDLTNCTSTRLVPAYASGGQANYLLTKPDPTGVTPGSKYEDLFRGVRVVLESWDKAEAVVRVWSA